MNRDSRSNRGRYGSIFRGRDHRVETTAASVIVTGRVAIEAISSVKDAASLWLQGIKWFVQGDDLTDW